MPYKDSRQQRAAQEAVRDRNRAVVLDHLLTHPCVDCGEADPVVLEFDHVRGVKEFGIADSLTRYMSVERLTREIAKCEVRCANCHRRRTAATLGHWRAAS